MAALWLMIAVVGTALLGFLSVLVWLENRRKEREAHYRHEMARRIAEAADPTPVMEYLRGVEQADAARTRMKARMAGMVTAAVGVALMIFLHQAAPATAAYLVGLIPLLVGVALLIISEAIMRRKA
ncbi:MAG: DUF6249 domain-containing protein [Stenotrophomonas sp.]